MKAFFNEQHIKIEETTEGVRVEISSGKLKISKEHFSPKIGIIKDKNDRGLGDAREIKKRWKEYMEELYKKDPNELDFLMVCSVTQRQTFWSVRSRGP